MRPVDLVLDRLEGVKQRGESYQALCPAHDDNEPSLSVAEGEDGRALLKCFAGCETEDVVAALGLEMKDLFERRNGHEKVLRSTPPKTTATVQPCNLENYADGQGLAGRVPTEAGSSGPEVPGTAGGAHLLPRTWTARKRRCATGSPWRSPRRRTTVSGGARAARRVCTVCGAWRASGRPVTWSWSRARATRRPSGITA